MYGSLKKYLFIGILFSLKQKFYAYI